MNPRWTHAKSDSPPVRSISAPAGLPQGRPQWVRRVRRSSASSEGFVSLVTASALGPPRLHDPTGSFCLAPPKAGLLQPPVGPLAPVAPPVLQIAAPDNDASAAAEPILNVTAAVTGNKLRPVGDSRFQPYRCPQTHDKRLLREW